MTLNRAGLNMKAYICPECMGTGCNCFICNEEERFDNDYVPIYDFEVCAFCHGKGYIEEGE